MTVLAADCVVLAAESRAQNGAYAEDDGRLRALSPPADRSYWLAAADGSVFTFGRARVLGSTGDLPLNRPVVGLTLAVDHRSER